jgi:hypothetical protein
MVADIVHVSLSIEYRSVPMLPRLCITDNIISANGYNNYWKKGLYEGTCGLLMQISYHWRFIYDNVSLRCTTGA